VSEYIKSELLNWARLSPDHVKVIYNPITKPQEVDPVRAIGILSNFGLVSKRYFLSVTNPKPHKNILMLVKAHQRYLDSTQNEFPLVLTVPKGTIKNKLKGVCELGGVTDEELSVLYHNCKAFFFPSLYEGFGRPPVEAALVGVPVFVSDIAPIRESARIFNLEMDFIAPSSVDAWVEKFRIAGALK
jgi:glycosyltransferase involved in cell wall biosynthesis